MRRLFCLVIIALASASPARAACENLPQTEMNVCAGEAFQQADAALNALYQEIKQRLAGDAETTTLFVAAQRAWLPFRDAECAFAASGVRQQRKQHGQEAKPVHGTPSRLRHGA